MKRTGIRNSNASSGKEKAIAGTTLGGLKAKRTNKRKHGADYYARIGSMGGKAQVPKGFACMTPEKRAEAGRKGGRISKRGKSLKPRAEYVDHGVHVKGKRTKLLKASIEG